MGDRRPLSVLNNINVGEGGVLLMNLQVEGQSDPIKLIVVGSASAETNIFTIGVKDNQYICGATPPGMVVQTAEGVGGVVTVNGIDIELH